MPQEHPPGLELCSVIPFKYKTAIFIFCGPQRCYENELDPQENNHSKTLAPPGMVAEP